MLLKPTDKQKTLRQSLMPLAVIGVLKTIYTGLWTSRSTTTFLGHATKTLPLTLPFSNTSPLTCSNASPKSSRSNPNAGKLALMRLFSQMLSIYLTLTIYDSALHTVREGFVRESQGVTPRLAEVDHLLFGSRNSTISTATKNT